MTDRKFIRDAIAEVVDLSLYTPEEIEKAIAVSIRTDDCNGFESTTVFLKRI
jgi:hypothetical protein